jgi:putative hydrolase of the HAD superfamily
LDLGQVICPFDLMIPCRKLSAMNGRDPMQIKKEVFFGQVERDFETGKIGGETFTRRCNDLLGLSLSVESFRQLWCDMFSFNPSALALVDELRSSSQLLLLSNTCPWHIEHVENLFDLRRHFDDWILSYEIGAMKPDRLIYEAAVKRLRSRCEATAISGESCIH